MENSLAFPGGAGRDLWDRNREADIDKRLVDTEEEGEDGTN